MNRTTKPIARLRIFVAPAITQAFVYQFSLVLLVCCWSLATTTPAHGALIYTLSEVGNDVVLEGSGSFIIPLSVGGTDPFQLQTQSSTLNRVSILPLRGFQTGVLTTASPQGITDLLGVTGPTNFGPGPGFVTTPGVTGTGMLFAFYFNDNNVGGSNNRVDYQTGYVSGSQFTTGATFANQTFASLGVTPGTYTWTFNTTGDTITLSVVPEPTSAVLLAGLGGVALSWRSRRMKSSGN